MTRKQKYKRALRDMLLLLADESMRRFLAPELDQLDREWVKVEKQDPVFAAAEKLARTGSE